MTAPRPVAARVTAVAAGALLAVGAAAPAQAAGYRYWSFWESDGAGTAWAYATEGPATARPADGESIGFRFAVSEDTSDATRPATGPDFAEICGGVPRRDGTKRVAVVVDFGGPRDAPPGEAPPAEPLRTGCAEVREDATSAEALAAVVKPLRYDSAALLCGIGGYPRQGCGEQVAAEPPAADVPASTTSGGGAGAGGSGGGPSFGVLAGGAAVLALGGAAVWKARRRG
ncbi:SCO2322 family protein [Streptomyces sp. NPDC003327]